MRLKGINPIEKHVEKFVLVVFGLALLGLLVLQFLGEPNAVEINGRTYAPGEVREHVRSLAQQKMGQLESIEAAPELAGDLPDYVVPFQAMLAGERMAEVRIASFGETSIIRPDGAGDFTPDQGPRNNQKLLHIAAVPMPASPAVAQFEGTVDPIIGLALVDQIPQLTEQPYDLRGISIQTSFDASEFKAMLNNPPADRSRVPLDWLRTIQILDVEFARERLVDGDWVDDGLVAPMPGRESLRAMTATQGFRPSQLADLLKGERENRIDVRSPAVYEMIAGLPWVAPVDFSKVRRTLPDQARVTRILSSLRSKDAEIERLAARRAGLADDDGRAERLDREIEKLSTEREAIVAELVELGVDEEGNTIEQVRTDLMTMPPDRADSTNLLDEPGQITLWTHDVGADKGSTFRYRARVVLTNPFFGRESRLQPSQKPEARSLVVKSDWSEWSTPIDLLEDVQYFVLDANPGQESNGIVQPASARITTAKFFYGYWRTAESRLEIGSLISTPVSLPQLWTWDIVESDDGAMLGEQRPLSTKMMITYGGFLLGVTEAILETNKDTSIESLDTLVVLHGADLKAPETRTPEGDRKSPDLATIRFSAQKGQNTTPESQDTEAGI